MEPSRRHIAVCAFPFGSHAAPLLNLVRRMVAETSTDIIFSFINSENSNANLFKSNEIPNILPCSFPKDSEKISQMETVIKFINMAPVNLRRGLETAEMEVGVVINLIVSDAFLWQCSEIAEEKGVLWVPVWASSQNSLSAHIYTDALRTQFRELQGKEDEIANCVPGFSTVRFSDLPSGVVSGDFDFPFSQMVYQMGLVLPKAPILVISSCEEFAPIITDDLKSKTKVLCVGPFSLISPVESVVNDQYGCISWLDKQKPQSVSYICFGSFVIPPQQELVALAEALQDVKVPFIWSMNETMKVQLPSSFLEWVSNNEMLGKIVSWAPQRKILTHHSIGVFITHCGWNSVTESIGSAVPLICKPVMGEQMLNQRFIEDELKFGIGIQGGVFTKDSVINALHQVLSMEIGKQMRERAKVLQQLVKNATKSGGSSDNNFISLIELITSHKA